MSKFPEIKGITWLSEDFPDIVSIQVTLEDRSKRDLGIPGLAIDNIEVPQIIDLFKLSGIRPWFEAGSDDASTTECLVDLDGVDQMVMNISMDNLIKAWLFYKKFKYDSRNI